MSNLSNDTIHPDAKKVLDFWYANQDKWFIKSDEFDTQIKNQFGDILQCATKGELWQWRTHMLGWLAQIIVLDQFSRNAYRNSPKAFTQDGAAVILAQEAVAKVEYQALQREQRQFILMPFMHSESLEIHNFALPLFEALDNPNVLDFEHKHKVIIERFGRYPHRNAILGRASTDEEIEFLKQPNSSF